MMRKIFSILSFVFLYVAIAFGQAAVEFEIIIHDNAGSSDTLSFGLDLDATDGLDLQLDEFDLPPFPPGNTFDVRWWLPPFDGILSSWKDYRAPGDPPAFPYTGTKEHVIRFQSPDFPMTIIWDLPTSILDSSIIADPFGLQILSFSGKDSMVIDLAAIPQVDITIYYNNIAPVGIEVEEDLMPNDYALFQNYPNPFNPNTKIQFQVPNTSNVNIKIYDMLGQEIRTLFAGEVVQGVHTVEWDGLSESGINMSSGIYIYRIVAGEFIQSKEMVLMK